VGGTGRHERREREAAASPQGGEVNPPRA